MDGVAFISNPDYSFLSHHLVSMGSCGKPAMNTFYCVPGKRCPLPEPEPLFEPVAEGVPFHRGE